MAGFSLSHCLRQALFVFPQEFAKRFRGGLERVVPISLAKYVDDWMAGQAMVGFHRSPHHSSFLAIRR